MRAIFPKCAWLIIPFARCENKKHQKERIYNTFLPLAPVPSNVKVRMSVCLCPLVPGCMLVTVSAIRLRSPHPRVCPVPIAAAGDSGHTFHQPTLSCSPSVARQTLVTGNQVRSHCRDCRLQVSIRTQPSHQLTSSSEERVGHDGR